MTAIIIPTWLIYLIAVCTSITALLDLILFIFKRIEARQNKRAIVIADALLKARSEKEE